MVIRRRAIMRLFRPTVETFLVLVAFCLLGLVLNIFWTLDHSTSPDSYRKWFPNSDEENSSLRIRVRRKQLDEFLRERDELQREKERLVSYSDLFNRLADDNEGDEIIPEAVKSDKPIAEREAGPLQRVSTISENKLRTRSQRNVTRQTKRNKYSTQRMSNDFAQLAHGFNDPPKSSSASVKNAALPVVRAAGKPEAEGERWCTVYNTTREVVGYENEFDCIRLRIKPPTTICLYSDDDDVHVSRHLRQDGLWEPHEVRLFQNLLFQNPDLDVIDIGAQLGEYSLLAASMGRRVVAVEPLMSSVRRLHKAIKIGRLEDKMTVVINPISDARGEFVIDVPDGNQGGASLRYGSSIPCDDDDGRPARCPLNTTSTVLMDDLVEVVDFRRAVMKVDIEGHEHRAFARADKLFDKVKIPYVFMEWIKLRSYYGAEVDDTEDKRRVQSLVEWFDDRGYIAYSLVLIQRLNIDYWYGWPDDVIWQHSDADPFF